MSSESEITQRKSTESSSDGESSNPVDMDRVWSVADVARHGDEDSCWIIMHGNVYDSTDFALSHPGGEAVIHNLAGKDATMAFENVGHSPDAEEQVKKLRIGKLNDEEAAALAALYKSQSDAYLKFLIPVIIIIIILIVKFVL